MSSKIDKLLLELCMEIKKLSLEDIKAEVEAYIKEKTQDEWLTPKQVQERYGFSVSVLAKWRMDRIKIPYHKTGKFIRYSRTDIEEFIQKTKEEIE